MDGAVLVLMYPPSRTKIVLSGHGVRGAETKAGKKFDWSCVRGNSMKSRNY